MEINRCPNCCVLFKDSVRWNPNCTVTTKNCGYCGKIGCSITLEPTSGRSAQKVYGPKSADCDYFYSFSLKSAEKISALNPCTNRPVKCDLCNLVI